MNHLNEMKNLAGKLSLVFVLLCALVVQSCKDDDEDPDPVTVEFSTGDISVQETAAPQTISVSLGQAAFRDGNLSISVSPQNAADVLSVPTTVPITKGSTAVQFNVTPVNNTAVNSISQITLTLSSVGDGFMLGTKKEIKITILDDEGPAQAGFELATGTVAEGSEGVTVSILLSRSPKSAGSLTIAYSPTDAKITTTPAATAGKITVPVPAASNVVSFTVVPNDGATANGDLDITFTITEATGSDITPVANTKHVLTVKAKPEQETISIADLRAAFKKSHKIGADTTIVGTVISMNDNVTNRNVWVHDGTAGILVRFNEPNFNAGVYKFERGTEISIPLTGATFQEFNGTLQVGNGTTGSPELPQASVTVLGTKPLPAYKTITIDALNTGAYEGELVKIEGVNFKGADGVKIFANNNIIMQGTDEGTFRIETYATFKPNVMPQGSGNVMGIASEFTASGAPNPSYQLTPQTADDIFTTNTTATITVSANNTLDFGDVDNGSESAVQSYTVSGASLTTAVAVTAPTHFQVSLTEGSGYGSSVSITAANAMAGPVTVYVKFVPTSGNNQTVGGNISHASDGAATVNVAVTGNETGNGANPLPTIRINEIHYDNESGDVGEFIEIMTTNPSLDISHYQIVLYNGPALYGSNNTINVSAMTKTEADGRAYYVWNAPVDGIQNGASDGIALVNNGAVVEFLSYEGGITATAGPANGMTSTDIGVAEGSTTKAGASLQRKADGSWEVTETSTKDGKNVNE